MKLRIKVISVVLLVMVAILSTIQPAFAKEVKITKQDTTITNHLLTNGDVTHTFTSNMQVNNATSIEVTNVQELQQALQNASDQDVITLAKNFAVDADFSISKPGDKQVIIEGNGVAIGEYTMTISGQGSKPLILQNLHFTASNQKQAIRILTNTPITLRQMEFIGRAHLQDGGAVLLGVSDAQVTIEQCSFIENSQSMPGYSGAAISATSFRGTLTIANSLFRNNKNLAVGNASFGGEGGAVCINQALSGAVIQIRDNYFVGNEAVKNVSGDKAKLADGGALAVFNIVNAASLTIEGNTFAHNVAGDDGGAILIQTNDNMSENIVLKNNTFYRNVAQGASNDAYSGGAVQIYANGGLFQGRNALIIFEHNTFAYNQAKSAAGAIGGSGYATNASGGRYRNNLFVGNVASDPAFASIRQKATPLEDLGGNVGIDNGVAANLQEHAILGSYPATLTSNHSSKTAGASRSSEIIPTLPIKPEGQADEVTPMIQQIEADQRNHQRIGIADAGSIEQSWVKYDANGGNYQLQALEASIGDAYYEPDALQDNRIHTYYYISCINQGKTVLDGVQDLQIVRDGYQFVGWSKQANDTLGDLVYTPGNRISCLEENITLYAVWQEEQLYDVVYDGNGHTAGEVPVDVSCPYAKQSSIQVLTHGDLRKDGYEFVHWNTQKDGSGSSYKANDTLIMDGATTLYAQWKKVDQNEKGDDTIVVDAIDVPDHQQPEQTEKQPPETADSQRVYGWIVLLLITLTGFITYVKRKKQQ